MSKIPADLGRSLGKNNNQNHCAHFVSHMMGYESSGPTCKNFTWADKQQPAKGATIRVDDIFKQCTKTGLLSVKPAVITECLVFVTLTSNVKKIGAKLVMKNNPKKHIGILSQGKIWNYSNSNNKVVADSRTFFIAKFANAYKTTGTTVEFYYGNLL